MTYGHDMYENEYKKRAIVFGSVKYKKMYNETTTCATFCTKTKKNGNNTTQFGESDNVCQEC